jgi:DNA-binding IscR family transcriptional regulator
MNSQITVQYALMCLQELDQHHSESLSPHVISARQGIPLPECEGILHRLEESGVIDGREHEQFALARPIEEINALEILQALWAPRKKAPAFQILYQSGRPALRRTLQAVSSAKRLGCFPSDGKTEGSGH